MGTWNIYWINKYRLKLKYSVQSNIDTFYPLEFVGPGGETQLQVAEITDICLIWDQIFAI